MIPGSTGTSMPAARSALDEAEVVGVVEEHLGDQHRDAGVDLGAQVSRASARFRVARADHAQLAGLAGERGQLGGRAEAARRAPGPIPPAPVARRVAAQRQHVVGAVGGDLGEQGAERVARRADAGQVRHRLEADAHGRAGGRARASARGSSRPRRR